jgi:hypothetical protein
VPDIAPADQDSLTIIVFKVLLFLYYPSIFGEEELKREQVRSYVHKLPTASKD